MKKLITPFLKVRQWAQQIEEKRRRRGITLLFIVLSFAYASVVGGSFSYVFLYASILIPLTSVLYMFYVYRNFKVYQILDGWRTIKGKEATYHYVVSNEDIIYYHRLCILFEPQYSTVELEDVTTQISLLPGEKYKKTATILCHYRGFYSVGIDAIEISDLLGLFTKRAEKPYLIRAEVYPRIVELSSIDAIQYTIDEKQVPFLSQHVGEISSGDVRMYHTGDDLRTVHWKLSAKQQELYVKKYVEPPKEGICLLFDTLSWEKRESHTQRQDVIVIEDILFETLYAVMQFYARHQTAVHLMFCNGSLRQVEQYTVRNLTEFQHMYEETALLKLKGEVRCDQLLVSYKQEFLPFSTLLLLTTDCTQEIISSLQACGIPCCYMLAGDYDAEELRSLQEKLGKITMVNLPTYRNITQVLQG